MRGTFARSGALLALLGVTLFGSARARADDSDEVLIERTRSSSERAPLAADPELHALANRVDAIVQEAAQDLGLTLDLSEHSAHPHSEDVLIQEANKHWVIAPQLDRAPQRGAFTLQIVAVPPGSSVLFVRRQTLQRTELDMRIVTMMRDLIEAARGTQKGRGGTPPPLPAPASPATPAHSPGRAILALNSALLGGYAGFSLQRASGSDDAHLVYPLIALGAGVGLGGSMLVTEEWNIGIGDAWFLTAGMWWPALSGYLLSESYGASPDNRFAYGLLGATVGLTLNTALLGFGHMSEGGAALAHTGSGLGTVFGALTELIVDGSTSKTPTRGMGFGAASGFLVASALALRIETSASRVMFIDLAASLGALTGAAAASPLLLVDEDEVDAKRNRLWLASVGAGTLLGGAVGYLLTRPTSAPSGTASAREGARPKKSSISPSFGLLEWGPRGPLLGPTLSGTW